MSNYCLFAVLFIYIYMCCCCFWYISFVQWAHLSRPFIYKYFWSIELRDNKYASDVFNLLTLFRLRCVLNRAGFCTICYNSIHTSKYERVRERERERIKKKSNFELLYSFICKKSFTQQGLFGLGYVLHVMQFCFGVFCISFHLIYTLSRSSYLSYVCNVFVLRSLIWRSIWICYIVSSNERVCVV